MTRSRHRARTLSVTCGAVRVSRSGQRAPRGVQAFAQLLPPGSEAIIAPSNWLPVQYSRDLLWGTPQTPFLKHTGQLLPRSTLDWLRHREQWHYCSTEKMQCCHIQKVERLTFVTVYMNVKQNKCNRCCEKFKVKSSRSNVIYSSSFQRWAWRNTSPNYAWYLIADTLTWPATPVLMGRYIVW